MSGGLDRRGSRPDDADPLAREVDPFVGPAPRVADVAFERVETRDVRQVRRREAASGHHAEARRHPLAPVGRQRPASTRVVEVRRDDARAELDVPTQVEAIGHVLQIAKDLGLRRVALAPFPLLLQLFRELVGVLHALDVAARAGIAVPVPGAPHTVAGLEHARPQSEAAQAVQRVEPREARAHHYRVARLLVAHGVSSSPRGRSQAYPG